jgi:hypothetical protein
MFVQLTVSIIFSLFFYKDLRWRGYNEGRSVLFPPVTHIYTTQYNTSHSKTSDGEKGEFLRGENELQSIFPPSRADTDTTYNEVSVCFFS